MDHEVSKWTPAFDTDLTYSTVTSQREQVTIDPAFDHSENDKRANGVIPDCQA